MRGRAWLAVAAAAAIAAGGWWLLRAPAGLRDCDSARQGLWDVCQRGETVHFGVPRALLERELVVVKSAGVSSGGASVRYELFRWVRRGDRLVAQVRVPREFAAPDGRLLDDTRTLVPWQDAAVLSLASGRPFGDLVVDATALFVGPRMLGGEGTDPGLARFKRTLSFPENVVIQTQALVPDAKTGTRPVTHEWNFVALPRRPMMPRRADDRTPFMPIAWRTGMPMNEKIVRPELAVRWRLEKKHPEQAISEPVEPIVYYIDPSAPKAWRPYLKRAIEAWNVAFEAAGFRNAIVAREAPEDDPEFGFDVRHTVLVWDSREWLRQVVDPRTGEILQGGLISSCYWILNEAEDGYANFPAKHYVRAAAVDPEARRFPFGFDLEARMVAFVATHEMGHNLGLKDGSYGKGVYTVEQVRDPAWVEEHGFTPSILNYARSNYVAQPGDGMASGKLLQKVGPADRYWIRALYQPFPDAKTVWDEVEPMEALLAERLARPELLFNGGMFHGPDSTSEVVETDDPIAATRLGLLNLKRAIAMAPEALRRGGGIGRGNATMIQRAAVSTWYDLMRHVAAQIGGYRHRPRDGREQGPERLMVAADRQREAMRFIVQEGFRPPTWLRDPALSRLLPTAWRWKGEGDLEAVLAAQRALLHELVGRGSGDPALERLSRLAAAEVDSGHFVYPDAERYPLTEFLGDLGRGIWGGLDSGAVSVDPYRQGLQEAHVQALKETLAAVKADKSAGEMYSWFGESKVPLHAFINNAVAAELRSLARRIDTAEARAADPVTLAHLKRMRTLIGPV